MHMPLHNLMLLPIDAQSFRSGPSDNTQDFAGFDCTACYTTSLGFRAGRLGECMATLGAESGSRAVVLDTLGILRCLKPMAFCRALALPSSPRNTVRTHSWSRLLPTLFPPVHPATSVLCYVVVTLLLSKLSSRTAPYARLAVEHYLFVCLWLWKAEAVFELFLR